MFALDKRQRIGALLAMKKECRLVDEDSQYPASEGALGFESRWLPAGPEEALSDGLSGQSRFSQNMVCDEAQHFATP
jgi:hypothetical protein